MSRRLSILPLALVLSLAPAGLSMAAAEVNADAKTGRYSVTFRHQPVIACQSVAVAGSWNGWSKTQSPLLDRDGDGTYEATLDLPRGLHHYKFVINGTVWQHDADNPRTEADGHSGFNSVLDLGGGEAEHPGQTGDGKIDAEQLIHDPSDLGFASAVDGKRRLILRIHTLREDVQSVVVKVSPRAQATEVAARPIAVVKGRTVWEARLSFSKAPSKVRYSFELRDGETTVVLPPGKRQRFTLATKDAARLETPDWVRDAVFYQIFPDRFRDGNPNNQPALPKRPEGKPWHIDDRYLESWEAQPSHFNFMGGDLAGVTEQADYIKSLGVNALYLNPIFKAVSNHRYDAADYETIDPALGTLDEFHALRDAFKSRKMRLILDCVFNHTGDGHYAFQDAKQKGPKSKYWDWYFFDGGFPVIQSPKPNYRAWWGFGSLPQLNTKNPAVVDHLLKVSTRWLKEGSQGWRLDVPNDLDAVNPEFWPEFRRKVKAQDPEAYVVGEIWTDARAWLQGDKFDAVMNYPVRSAALEFCAKGGIDAAAFRAKLSEQLATYPEAALRVQFNLLGSHDTARLLTVAGGDARRARLAMTFLFAWPGAPVIYYGDEVGVDGGKDPECRKTFPWEPARQDQSTLAHVRALGKLRADERTLRRGTVRFLAGSDPRVSAFVREAEQGEAGRPVLCLLNSKAESVRFRVPLGELEGAPQRLLGEGALQVEGGELVIELKPYEGALIGIGAGALK